MPPTLNGMLLRVPANGNFSLAAGLKHLSLSTTAFEFEPLFAVGGERALGMTTTKKQWYLARPTTPVDGANPWDVAHELLASFDGLGIDDAQSPDLIEPDLMQSWLLPPEQPSDLAAAEACSFEDQNELLPRVERQFAWHLGDDYSQLATARDLAKASPSSARILHMDTGYDPKHVTYPKTRIETDLQRNFIDSDRPTDARDLGVDGLLLNPGHGTGTLGILAGGEFRFSQNGYEFKGFLGGAPQAKIVPVRVGNSVVQLTTSSVAKGIGHAVELCNNSKTRVDVISMSMGGVASAAWADAVNAAYLAGVVYVAAAGNNFSTGLFGFPTRHIVYPARFRRVIAVCGVMADGRPYYGLDRGTMQGNWGPSAKMATAMAAYTPNMPWARWGCAKTVVMNGPGTSSATPQVAAAAALYLQKHAEQLFNRSMYQPWMRVEAVREALFSKAHKPQDAQLKEMLGNGILRAADALTMPPADPRSLRMTRPDSAGFPFLNVLSRTGLAPSARDRMLELEATQLVQDWDRDDEVNPLETAVSDPDQEARSVSSAQIEKFLEAVSQHPRASDALRRRAHESLSIIAGPRRRSRSQPGLPEAPLPEPQAPPHATQRRHSSFTPPTPPHRKIRGYAVDPSLSTMLSTVGISEVTFKVPWEKLKPGPVGEYLEVVDIDPTSNLFYEPVHLDDPLLLAQDGLPPSDGVPQFHQQMVYAVASLTIQNFERALGRKALWRPGPPPPGTGKRNDSHYVRRLRIYPHALREANAFYSPRKVALLFGYFNAVNDNSGDKLPGGRVFTCLSHDIIAHETVHALLDGMHRQFLLPSNPDVHAFHEAFADCVAMLQHFTFPELVAHQISTTRGAIDSQENLLVQLAAEFGRATGKRTALRDAIGAKRADGQWKLSNPDPSEYEKIQEPHARGRILVAAVFEAFLAIYRRRTADVLRLATGGTGVLRPGAIHPDLVHRLAEEAAKSAQHVLHMCIRALDYCPPTDITFGEYLRAIVTADADLVADDDLGYRVSFVEAFRRRGIFPPGIRTLSVSSLLWRKPEEEDPQPSATLRARLKSLRGAAERLGYAQSRKTIFHLQRRLRKDLHDWLKDHFQNGGPEGACDAAYLGIQPGRRFEVHTARVAWRASPDGGIIPQLLVGLLQRTTVPVDPRDPKGPKMPFEGGCTVVADLRAQQVKYCIRKHLLSQSRRDRQQQFALSDFDSLQATYLGTRKLSDVTGLQEPFALIHRQP